MGRSQNQIKYHHESQSSRKRKHPEGKDTIKILIAIKITIN